MGITVLTRTDVVASLLGRLAAFWSICRGQAKPAPDQGVAEGHQVHPPDLRRRCRLVRRPGIRIGLGQRLGVEHGPLLRGQGLPVRLDLGLGFSFAELRLADGIHLLTRGAPGGLFGGTLCPALEPGRRCVVLADGVGQIGTDVPPL